MSPNLLMTGLIAVILLATAAALIRKEKFLMTSRSDALHVSFLGSGTSPSGLSAVTDITYENPGSKAWPHLSVSIFGHDGDRLYQSIKYAAWFTVNLCWDDADRLWIASADTGIDVIAATPSGWRRHRWMAAPGTKTMLDVESGESLSVVNWPPPHQIKAGGGK